MFKGGTHRLPSPILAVAAAKWAQAGHKYLFCWVEDEATFVRHYSRARQRPDLTAQRAAAARAGT